MDLLAHAVYGATLCSRSGLAGGSRGFERTGRGSWSRDKTVWWSALFGILPDVLSMGPPLAIFFLSGMPGNFFHALGSDVIVSYRYAHSLIVALLVSGLLCLRWKRLLIPSLAWPIHILLDAATHSTGKFHTTLFYPLSTWGFSGIRWWEHPEVILAYWLVPPAIWIFLFLRRWKVRRHSPPE